MAPTNPIDFNIHGIVGIRLLNATPSDVAAVAKQLGPMKGPISSVPDITIRFERHLPLTNLRYLGLDKSGFTDEGYYILRSSKAATKVRIPFEQVGGQCEIVCESGLRSVPLLIAILNQTLIKKGYLPLHASAFVHRGTGILVTGWSKGGKTEAMLTFTHNGARYVGDEWVILSGDGEKMFGLPEPITTWDWHLEHLPRFRHKVKPGKFRLFKAIRLLDKISQNAVVKKSPIGKALSDSMSAFKRQLHVNLPPEKLFGVQGKDLLAKPEKLFFVVSHESPDVTVTPGDADEIAERMISSLEYEQGPIQEHYSAFKFAFPGERNEFLERTLKVQYEILCQALRGKEAYVVAHPYPVDLSKLLMKMRPYCEKRSNGMGGEAAIEAEFSEALS